MHAIDIGWVVLYRIGVSKNCGCLYCSAVLGAPSLRLVMTAAQCIVDRRTCEPPRVDCQRCVDSDRVYGGLFNNSRVTEDEVTRRMVEVDKK